jgi:hypothetical protein
MSREKKFTKGPWKAVKQDINDKYQIHHENGLICVIDEFDRTHIHANAHLISAAPELLEALEEMCDMCSDNLPPNSQRENCGNCKTGKAISKAYGESQ